MKSRYTSFNYVNYVGNGHVLWRPSRPCIFLFQTVCSFWGS